MDSIPRHWLVKKLKPSNSPRYKAAAACFAGEMQEGDEIWDYDEPAPEGVNAGELGLALVRDGEPIDQFVQGIH